jgi:hypothetical protein
MASDVVLRTLTPADYELWHKLIAESPQGSVYALPEYLEILCRAAGGSCSLLGVFRGNELIGGLPLYEQPITGGRSLANRLLLYYSGLILKPLTSRYPSKATSKHLDALEAIASWLVDARYARIILNHQGMIDARPFLNRQWTARPGYTYVVPIADIQNTWNRIDQNLRRLVDRCAEAGATLSDDDDFTSFFAMHLETHKRKGAPLYLPKEAFSAYFKEVRSAGLGRLYQTRLSDGRAVAGQLVLLGPAGRSYTVCAAADPEHLNLGTTPWLRWEAFKALARDGYTTNDLTDAALNEVTRFKSQLGGYLVTNMIIQQPDCPALLREQRIARLRLRATNFVTAGARRMLGRR